MKASLVSRIVTFLVIFSTLVIIVPFFAYLLKADFSFLIENTNGFTDTLRRTIIYSICCCFLLIAIGFIGAIVLRSLPFFSCTGKSLGLLIIPITLGNISIAFICKLLIGNSSFFSFIINENNFFKLLFACGLQVWQYGLLFIYLYWLSFNEIPVTRFEYAKANRFSLLQKIKDIYLPYSKNLSILLLILGFSFSIFDDSKISYLFKVSEGTNSEIITNWLTRNYHSSILLNSQYAQDIIFRAATDTFIILLTLLILLFFIIKLIFSLFSKFKLYPSVNADKQYYALNKFFAIFLILIILIPLILPFFKIDIETYESYSELGFSLLMVFFASFFASTISIIFGITARLGWPNLLKSFTTKSLLFFAILFLLVLIPPIIITICGYKWMAIIGYREEWVIELSWIIGHTILFLPLLGSFVLFTHFRVSNNELNYLKIFKLNSFEIVKKSFVSRFKAEYLLLFIIAYSSVWNESVLNSLFSDYIPSFASRLKMLITGSASDYSKAVGFLLISFLISLVSVILWRIIIEKAQKNFENS